MLLEKYVFHAASSYLRAPVFVETRVLVAEFAAYAGDGIAATLPQFPRFGELFRPPVGDFVKA